ncbi:integrase [Xanthomonas campestris pv. raphani]|uniref:integrase n=1 Tax=Xanthomonas campestris TaxID=339 RepID=UPI002B239A27|nr:integrase [Xanthomonas campestris]MEA9753138.1 integrase [Xanthomonas campestris pv. raphani]MEA9813343.1 integrase [Xanthomonas campestris pv. raphani]
MLSSVNPNDNMAAVRLLDFFASHVPWHRSLWGVGTILAMEELHEGCSMLRQGHLSKASIERMSSALLKRVGNHPAFEAEEKQFLRQQIAQIPRAEGAAHHGLKQLATRASSDYLDRWARVVATGKYPMELFARSVAAHLLDAGFSEQHLHDLVKNHLNSTQPISLAELCEALQAELIQEPKREFEVLVAFSKAPSFPNRVPNHWLQATAIPQWLTANGFATSGVRAQVATLLTVHARDYLGAAKAAWDEHERHSARALLSTGKPLSVVPTLWVKGAGQPSLKKEAFRGVSVKELFRGDRIFSNDANQSVDAALELLAHLESSSAPAAIAGGWAAIEGLLADPSDRASAADNLAALVACSLPRAELTALAHRAIKDHPVVCAHLSQAQNNRERSRQLAQMIAANFLPPMTGLSDQAAVKRLKKLLLNPQLELAIIKDSIADSFHRLYRQRNLILHGGRLDGVALTASLRTVAKLAGAGMDRITHGHYVQGLRPLELVARANLSLALANASRPEDCADLLENT